MKTLSDLLHRHCCLQGISIMTSSKYALWCHLEQLSSVHFWVEIRLQCISLLWSSWLLLLNYHQIHGIITWGGWGCEVSCGGHHPQRGKTTMGSALDGAVLDIAQILAYLVHNISRSQLYLGFGHFGWLPSFFGQYYFGGFMVKLHFICWNYSFFSSGWHSIAE